ILTRTGEHRKRTTIFSMEPNTRRIFAKTAAATLLGSRLQSSSAMAGAGQGTGSGRKRSDASWFAACPFGISTHWTALSQAVRPADWRPFAEAVANFNVDRYVERIAGAGASYLIFTSAHALQQLAAPCDALDQVLPGRTTKRDMLGELARASNRSGSASFITITPATMVTSPPGNTPWVITKPTSGASSPTCSRS